MSRSNPATSQNPASIFYEWDGDKGHVRYYDKEKGENVAVKLPFQFLLLDQVSRIGGYSESQQAGFYSNEVKDITKEVLAVKTHGGGVVAQGLYRDIKDSIKSKGAKYVASLYIAVKEGENLVIQNFQMKGAALGGWMDFCKEAKGEIWQKAIIIDGMVEGKKGKVTYQTPTFRLNEVSEDTNEQATELDKELQRYLREKINHETQEVSKGEAGEQAYSDPEPEVDTDDDGDSLPF